MIGIFPIPSFRNMVRCRLHRPHMEAVWNRGCAAHSWNISLEDFRPLWGIASYHMITGYTAVRQRKALFETGDRGDSSCVRYSEQENRKNVFMDLEKHFLRRIVNALYRIPMKVFHKNFSRIIMFHTVSPSQTEDAPSCYCSLDDFLRILDYMTREGYRFVSMDECLKSLSNKIYTGQCVISFDDAMDDFYYHAYPVLKERKLPFVLYVPSGQLGMPRIMSKEQIAELSRDELCTIGSHTRNHVNCCTMRRSGVRNLWLKAGSGDSNRKSGQTFFHTHGGSVDDIFPCVPFRWWSMQVMRPLLEQCRRRCTCFPRWADTYLPRINAEAYFPLLHRAAE